MRRTQWTAVALGVAVAAWPAGAAGGVPVGTYVITSGTAAYQHSGPADLWPAGVDDAVVTVHPPFPLHVYGRTFRTINVSSNGNIQFTTSSASHANACLPNRSTGSPFIAVYWDDLTMRSHDLGFEEGVFLTTIGTVGHRQFVVSWRGSMVRSGKAVRAEILFDEAGSDFEMRYADGAAAGATIGVSDNAGRTTQFACNAGRAAVRSGLSLHYTLS